MLAQSAALKAGRRRPRPAPPDAPGTLDFYQSNAAEYSASTLGLDMGHAIARFGTLLEAGASVLDLGCGGGRDLATLRSSGLQPTGFDLSSHLAAIAAEHSGCEVVVGDMRDPPFASAAFDGIWAAASLLHLEKDDLLPTLRQLHRVLSPGGILFASMKMGMGTERAADGRLFTYVMPEDWTELLTEAGFHEVEVQTEVAGGRGKSSTAWIQSFARAG